MIVEGLMIAAIVALVTNATTVAKVAAVNKMIKRIRRRQVVSSPVGKAAIYIDEFINEEGEKQVDFSVEMHEGGQSYVITEKEGLILSRQAMIEGMIEAGLFNGLSAEGWRGALKPLFEAIDERNKEIQRSPGRLAIIKRR